MNNNDKNTSKAHKFVRVQRDGGYQNDFFFVERAPTTPVLWERLNRMTDKVPPEQM